MNVTKAMLNARTGEELDTPIDAAKTRAEKRKDLEASTFQKRPAYRYIRQTDDIPTYLEIEGFDDVFCWVKLFNPTGVGTWYIAAYDPDTRTAWGVAEIHEREISSFSMAELVEYRGRFGLPIERDLMWKPRRLSEIK